MTINKIYAELHKQLIRKQQNPFVEVLFFFWCYLSAETKFKLPEKLTIKNWIKTLYIKDSTSSALKPIFLELQNLIPELKESLTLLFDLHLSRFHHLNSRPDWELYASVFSRFPYEEAKQQDWEDIYSLILNDIARKEKTLVTDPLDLSKLIAQLFAQQSILKPPVNTKNKEKTVLIPSLATGLLAVELRKKVTGRLKFIGAELNLEAYCLAVFTFVINGLDTSGICLTEKNGFQDHNWNCFVSFLKPGDLDNTDELARLFQVINSNSDIAIVLLSQSFLFSNRYKMIRRSLLTDSNLTTVISLLPSVYSNTRIKSAILVFNKSVQRDSILLVNAENINWGNKRIVTYTEKEINSLADLVYNNSECDAISKQFSRHSLKTDNFSLLVSKRLPEENNIVNLKQIQRRITINQQELMGIELFLQSDFTKLLSK